MAGKPPYFASGAFTYALDCLSKNTLIDVLVDLVRAQIGEEASDYQVAAWLQPTINVIMHHRGDPRVDLQKRMINWRRDAKIYTDNLTMGQRHPELKLKGKNNDTESL